MRWLSGWHSIGWRAPTPTTHSVKFRATQGLTPKVVEAYIEEVRHFDDEIRQALRSNTAVLSLGLVVLTIGVGFIKDVSLDVPILAIPPLLGYAATLHFLNSADVAVMAEVRDRLAHIVNLNFDKPVMNVRLVSDIRRGSPATMVANYFLGLIFLLLLAGCAAYGWIRATADVPVWGGFAYFGLQLGLSFGATAMVLTAYREIPRNRIEAYRALDEVFGTSSRPDSIARWDMPK